MLERGDFTVLHERFLYLYYVVQNPHLVIAQQLETIEPWMRADFDTIVSGILAEAVDRPVFFKDMAVHVHNPKGYHADEVFLSRFSNAFLIRHPEQAVLSHLAQNPDMVFEEVGYDAQLAMFESVAAFSGERPVVIDAADLEEDAPGIVRAFCDGLDIPFLEAALSWEQGVPAELTGDDPWHADLYRSTGFERAMETVPSDIRHHPKFEEYRDRSMPFYTELHVNRIRPMVAG